MCCHSCAVIWLHASRSGWSVPWVSGRKASVVCKAASGVLRGSAGGASLARVGVIRGFTGVASSVRVGAGVLWDAPVLPLALGSEAAARRCGPAMARYRRPGRRRLLATRTGIGIGVPTLCKRPGLAVTHACGLLLKAALVAEHGAHVCGTAVPSEMRRPWHASSPRCCCQKRPRQKI